MNVSRLAVLLAAAAVFALAGCAAESTGDGGEATFPAKALVTLETGDGHAIEVRTAPAQPPSRGQSSVELTVLDEKGAAVDGLDVSAEPWMPAMGHGAATDPERTVLGEGNYRFDKVELFMPGTWELRVKIDGDASDRATAEFQIP